MKNEQVFKKPIVTEKSLAAAALGKYTFEVDSRAEKGEIARAVERAFGVHVVSLRTIRKKGKTRRSGSRRKKIVVSGTKKAIVKLRSGEKIEAFTVQEKEQPKKA